MRTYWAAQGILRSALWWPEWEGNPKERMYVYVQMIHLAVQQKLTQHCKPTIFQ